MGDAQPPYRPRTDISQVPAQPSLLIRRCQQQQTNSRALSLFLLSPRPSANPPSPSRITP